MPLLTPKDPQGGRAAHHMRAAARLPLGNFVAEMSFHRFVIQREERAMLKSIMKTLVLGGLVALTTYLAGRHGQTGDLLAGGVFTLTPLTPDGILLTGSELRIVLDSTGLHDA